MTPIKSEDTPEIDLFRNELGNLLDHRHALYQLADLIDWASFEAEFGLRYCDDNGSPASRSA